MIGVYSIMLNQQIIFKNTAWMIFIKNKSVPYHISNIELYIWFFNVLISTVNETAL